MFRQYSGTLPDSLLRQLKSYRNRLWRIRIVETLLISLINIGVAYIILYLSDRLWNTPLIILPALFILSFAATLVFSPYWLTKWVFLKKTPLQISRLLERRLPSVGDKLTGAIELASGNEENSGASETLKQAAIRQVSGDIAQIDLNRYIPHPKHRLLIAILTAILLVIAGLAILTPEASSNTFARWSNPGTPPARFTFTQLVPKGERLIVPMGEISSTTFLFAPTTEQTPQTARFQFDDGKWHQASMLEDGSGYEISIPAFQKNVPFRFKAGDADLNLTIVPKPRPAMQRAIAGITLPGYTGRAPQEYPVRAGIVSVLKGSSVILNAFSTEAIAEVRVAEGTPVPSIKGQEVTFPAVRTEDRQIDFTFSWRDTDGLDSHRDMNVRIEPVADQNPFVRLEPKSEERFLLPKTSLELLLASSDDYGLSELGVEWTGELPDNKTDQTPENNQSPPQSKEIVLKKGNQTTTSLDGAFIFQAEEQQIQPQKIVLRAFAKDHHPEHKRVYSEPLTVYVVSPEEHAQMIRQALERLVAGIEDIIRDMDGMTDMTEQLLKLSDENLKNKDSREKLETLTEQERSNIETLKDLEQEGQKLFRSASRNDQIDPEAMKKLMKALQSMEATANGNMEEARKSFDQSSRQNADQKDRMDEALNEHKKSADQLRAVNSLLSESSKNMEAATFAARLKLAARQEDSIIQSLASGINEMAGLTTKQLSTRQSRDLEDIHSRQATTMQLVRWIVEELNHFKERNTEPVYATLHKEMTDHSIIEKLESISERLKIAHIGTSIETASISSDLLKRWAKLLDDDKAGGGGGGSGGGGNDDSLSDEDMEFLLKVMRMIQQQQDIRLRTRTLEESKQQQPNPPAS